MCVDEGQQLGERGDVTAAAAGRPHLHWNQTKMTCRTNVRGVLGDEQDVRERHTHLRDDGVEEGTIRFEDTDLARQRDTFGERLEELVDAEPPNDPVILLPAVQRVSSPRRAW